MQLRKIKNYLKFLRKYPVDKNWLLENKRQLGDFMNNNPIKSQRSANALFNKFKFMPILQTKFAIPAIAGIIILALGGTAVASQDSLPNDTLYPVKIAIEKVELAIGSLGGEYKKAEIKLEHALKRLEEVQALIEEHQEDGVIEEEEENEETEAIENLEDQTEDAIEETEGTLEEENGEETLNKKERLVQKLEQLTERHQEVLQKVYDKVPEQAKKAIEHAMEMSKKGHERAIQAILKDKGKHKGWYKDEGDEDEGDEDEEGDESEEDEDEDEDEDEEDEDEDGEDEDEDEEDEDEEEEDEDGEENEE